MNTLSVVEDNGRIYEWWMNFHKHIDLIDPGVYTHLERVYLINKHLEDYEMKLIGDGQGLGYSNDAKLTAFLLKWS